MPNLVLTFSARRNHKHGESAMNYRAVCFAGSLLALSAGWMSTPLAGEMLGEGRFDFDICRFGKADYPRLAKGLVSSSFDRIATSIYGSGSSKDIDRQGSRCVGVYEVAAANIGSRRVHQMDADGDRWRMRYETGADLVGTWVR